MGTVVQFPNLDPDDGDEFTQAVEAFLQRQEMLNRFLMGSLVGLYIGLWGFGIYALARWLHG